MMSIGEVLLCWKWKNYLQADHQNWRFHFGCCCGFKGPGTSVTLIQRQLDVISRETQRIAVTCKLASGHSTQPTWHNTCNHDVLTNSNNCLLPPCRISWFSDNKKFVNWFTRFWDFLKNILICSLFSYKMRRVFLMIFGRQTIHYLKASH